MKVDVLIDHEMHYWKSDLIDDIFLSFEASAIKEIPLSIVDTPDWLFWPKNRTGPYSIKSRKLLQVGTCPTCNLEPETITHALWLCPKLVSVWLPQFAKLKKATSPLSTFNDLLHLAFQDPSCIEARSLVHEFNHLRPVHAKIPRTARLVRWKPPPLGVVKVNFDGAIFSTQSSAGLAMVVRDQAGLVLASLSQKIPLSTSVEIVEVIAARRALLLARELGFERVMVEGDSEIIIKAIKEKALPSSDLGHILEDIRVLSRSFNSISFHHIKRMGNCVAHHLAHRSFCNPLLVWMEEVPPDIVDVYNHDLGFIHE
uniref:RNase H type-1 domain-containing protein n=1 Tax=Quercus lobata TaxID=97700 RepID=A0A7N2KZZ0_QUELO